MGQSIISAGLIIIVTIAVINANRLIVNAETTKMEGVARLQAADLAMELITEARMKKFDENDNPTYYQSQNDFTVPSALGRDSEWAGNPDGPPYDSAKEFDDFDDYNGYYRLANTWTITGYQIRCKVFYANYDVPDVDINNRSYVKTLQVRISHPVYLTTPFTISMTKTY